MSMDWRGPCDGRGRCLYTMPVSSRELPFVGGGQDEECPHGCVFEKCVNSEVCGHAEPRWCLESSDGLCALCDATSKAPQSAGYRVDEECGVCYEMSAKVFKQPTCNHMLCERCYRKLYDVRTYGSGTGRRGIHFRCPFCRRGVFPGNSGGFDGTW